MSKLVSPVPNASKNCEKDFLTEEINVVWSMDSFLG